MLWASKLEGLGCIPHVAKDLIYVPVINKSTYVFSLCCFRKDDGSLLWKIELPPVGGTYNDMIITDKYVLLPNSFNKLAKINNENGKVIENLPLDKGKNWRWKSTPLLVSNNRIISLIGNKIIELEIEPNLTIKKITEIEDDIEFFGKPFYFNGILYSFSSFYDKGGRLALVAYNTNSNKIIFKKDLGRMNMVAKNAIGPIFLESRNEIIVPYYKPRISILNHNNGEEMKSVILDEGEIPLLSQPVFVDDRIYFGTNKGNIYKIKLGDNPKIENKIKLGGICIGQTTYKDSIVFYVAPYLYLIDKKSFGITKKIIIGTNPYTQPIEYEEGLYISGGDPPLETYLIRENFTDSLFSEGEMFLSGEKDEIFLNLSINTKNLDFDYLKLDGYILSNENYFNFKKTGNSAKVKIPIDPAYQFKGQSPLVALLKYKLKGEKEKFQFVLFRPLEEKKIPYLYSDPNIFKFLEKQNRVGQDGLFALNTFLKYKFGTQVDSEKMNLFLEKATSKEGHDPAEKYITGGLSLLRFASFNKDHIVKDTLKQKKNKK